jgi:FSR family fosmidomycin resistance protein-like MFS transporter
MSATATTTQAAPPASRTIYPVLLAISFCHGLNDMMQALLPAIYPLLKGGFDLSFAQLGLLTLVYQTTGSLLQPLVGQITDKRPMPYSLPVGMGFTLSGLLTLSAAANYPTLIAGAALLGIGSSIFHPESSRLARAASGGQLGMAQSLFQVGGNFGSAIGPLLAAFVVLPRGQSSLAWFALAALGGMAILGTLGHWYKSQGHARPRSRAAMAATHGLSTRQVGFAIAILIALMFSKYVYMSSLNNYYVFYLIDRFHIPVAEAQIYLFVFLAAAAIGTFIGGPVGDRIGRKYVIWGSILGVLPFTLALPYAGLSLTVGLSVAIGLILSSAFSAILVYATELLPGRVGMVAGLFFGLAFGMAGLGAAVLGLIADATSIGFVFRLCAFLPALGILAAFLPDAGQRKLAR